MALALGGALLGLLVSLVQKPRYEAHTSLEIVSLNEDFLNLKQIVPTTDFDASAETSEQQTQIKLLQSESLLRRVLGKLRTPEADGQNATKARSLDQELRKTAESLKVRASGRTRIIDISVDSVDPRLAAEFANTFDEEFIQQSMEARTKINQRTSLWLNHEIEDIRLKLENSENALQNYARESGLVFTDDKTEISEDALRHLEQDLSAAAADRIAKQARYELAMSSSVDSLPDIINDAGLQATRAKLTDLHRQIADMGEIYNSGYSKLRRLKAEESAVQSALDTGRIAILDRVRNEYREAVRKQQLLGLAYQVQTKKVTADGEKSIRYSILKREVESNRQLYDSLLQQLKGASMGSAMLANNVRIVDPAEIPKLPYSPKYAINIGLGGCLGLFAGVVFALFRERANDSIQEPGEMHFWTNILELGVVPSSGLKGVDELTPTVLFSSQTPTPMVEAFRAIRTSLMITDEKGSLPSILVLTSASPGEGKSMVTTNLGIALAESGRRVLIIDADLRRPSIHKNFKLDNAKGLSTLLTAYSPKDAEKKRYVMPSVVQRLDILPSGPPTNSAPELFCSPVLRELLLSFSCDYDIVLVDTPPCLPLADARILARVADGVVLVARARQTSRDALTAASKQFLDDGTPILGTILNDWNSKYSRFRYYDRQGYDEYAKQLQA